MSETKANSIANYALNQPTAAYAIGSLSRFMTYDEAKALWSNLCRKCAVDPATDDLQELETVFGKVSDMPGATGVVGKSLVVRAITFKTLMQKR